MSSNRLSRPLAAGIVLASVSLILAACGSSNSGAQSTPSNASPTTASPTPSMSASPTSSASVSASPTGGVTSASHQIPSCSSNIRVIKGAGQGAAGHLTLVLIFNNVGTKSCRMYGYPGVALVTGSGATVANARRTLNGMAGGVTSETSVTLAAGHSASALLEASDVPQGGIADCGSYQVMVTPPGQYVAVPADTAMMPKCDLQIHPVVAGTGGGMR